MKYNIQLAFLFLCVFLVINFGNSLVLLGVYNHKNNTYNELVQTGFVEPRRRKHKLHLILPLVVAALLMKSVVFPLVVKAMAVMSSIAVLLSFMSLIISSIIGYAKLAYKYSRPLPPAVKVIYVDKPWPKQVWSPLQEVAPYKYIPSDPFILENEEQNVVDHYHTFVD